MKDGDTTYFVGSLDTLPIQLRHDLARAGYHTVAALMAAADGDLLKIEGLRRRDLIVVRDALGQPSEHLKPRRPAGPIHTDEALALLADYYDCKPAHRELLAKLAKVLATKDDVHIPA